MRRLWSNIRIMAKRGYRSILTSAKQEAVVWEDMKKLHAEAQWRSGVYESDRCIETVFQIAEETPGVYRYWITENELHSMVRVLDGYNPELTTDIFVLASHFNNLLKNGTVEVNVETSTVTYRLKQNVLIPSLYTGEIYNQITMHHSTSQDVYWAFQKLVFEGEEPALIIADLLARKGSEEKEVEENKEH
jgi:hypothetical protein